MKKYLFVLLACVFLAAATIVALNRATAQGALPQLLITWQADTYVPDGFSGKVLPASDSPIIAGVDLIDMGRRVDLSPYKIFWYIDDKFYQGAVGLTRISFTAPHFIGENSVRVRVLVTDYGSGPGRTITIPIAVPEAVIQSSSPNLSAGGAPFNLQAYPYFFNVQDPSQLVFDWRVNGTSIGRNNPLTVTGEMAGRGAFRVELSVSNPTRPIERITQELSIPK